MAQEPERDPWEDDEDQSNDLFMERMVGAAKTFNLVVFALVVLLVAAMIGFVMLSRSA